MAAVFVGGCFGGVARYAATSGWRTPPYGFPWTTFTVNTSGAFALALLLVLVIEVLPPTTYLRPAVGTGFLGAWTTFSSVTVDVVQLTAHRHVGTAVSYLIGTVLAGLAAASLGLVAGRSASRLQQVVRPERGK